MFLQSLPTCHCVKHYSSSQKKRLVVLQWFDPKGKIIGLITERDICNAVAKEGESAVNRPASVDLNDSIISCGLSDRISKVMALMTSHRARHVLVLEEGAIVGIISIGDVVKYRLDEALQDEQSLRDYIAGTGY